MLKDKDSKESIQVTIRVRPLSDKYQPFYVEKKWKIPEHVYL